MRNTIAAARKFGAPISLVLRELDSTGMLDTAVENSGKYLFLLSLAEVVLSVHELLELQRTEFKTSCVISKFCQLIVSRFRKPASWKHRMLVDI